MARSRRGTVQDVPAHLTSLIADDDRGLPTGEVATIARGHVDRWVRQFRASGSTTRSRTSCSANWTTSSSKLYISRADEEAFLAALADKVHGPMLDPERVLADRQRP
jgi:hypothetical protein